MLDNKILLENIKKLCDNKGIKITNLEKELGFGGGIISRWGNSADPSLSKIIDIADYFHVSLDELVGYNQNVDDEFLNKLYNETAEGYINWLSYERIQKAGYNPKKFYMDYNEDEYNQVNYYFHYNNGYIIMYAMYKQFQALTPETLIIFIQPSDYSDLIEQKYKTKDLLKLWIKLLNSLGNEVPDEVKAEDLKNSFLRNANTKKFKLHQNLNDVEFMFNKAKRMLINIDCGFYDFETENTKIFIPQNSFSKKRIKSFYKENEKTLGKILEIRMENGEVLYLISNKKIMKFTIGSNVNYYEILDILFSIGFVEDNNDITIFQDKNFILYPDRKIIKEE